MKLDFVCPRNNKAFETQDYKVIQDRGVNIDDSGNEIWDAKVELTIACPFCGRRHVFRASELPCAFA